MLLHVYQHCARDQRSKYKQGIAAWVEKGINADGDKKELNTYTNTAP